MKASAGFTLRVIFENSLKIAQARLKKFSNITGSVNP